MSNKYERQILDNIAKHGWFCTSVFDPDHEQPTLSYSVGFTQTLACPEFIVFGLQIELMHEMLWKVFTAIKDGRRPEDQQRWSGLIQDYDCIARAVHASRIEPTYFNSAMWFWNDCLKRREDLQAFQLVWPSIGSNLYPWDAACPQIVRDHQPALYLPRNAA